jgi:hypothetical protein
MVSLPLRRVSPETIAVLEEMLHTPGAAMLGVMETIEPNARRNFLLAASLCGAGAVAVVAAAHTAPKVAAATAAEGAKTSGYRASPHILTYYKTTAF